MTLTALQTESPDLVNISPLARSFYDRISSFWAKPVLNDPRYEDFDTFEKTSPEDTTAALGELLEAGLIEYRFDFGGQYRRVRADNPSEPPQAPLRLVKPEKIPEPDDPVELPRVTKARKAFEFTSSGQTMGAFGNPFAEEPPVTDLPTPESGPEIASDVLPDAAGPLTRSQIDPEASSLPSKGRDTPKGGSTPQGRSEGRKVTGSGEKPNRSVPAPKVPTRAPKDQAEHMAAVFNSKRLKEYPAAHHLAMALHMQMGRTHKGAFGASTRVAKALLAELTGLSESTAIKAMNHAVDCGFFRRIDSRNGGKGVGSAATYVPTVPDFA